MTIRPLLIPALLLSLLAHAADPGEALYQQRCQVCHQPSGLGVPGVFPPLAGADFLVKQRERSIKALCEGLIGKITVNGLDYTGQMPAQALDDAAVAAVLNYIGTSWGNKLPTFTPQEIATVRAKTKFPTVEKLFAAMQFAPLPQPPAGYKLRELARLPDGEFGVRMATRDGHLWVLTQTGTVLLLDPKTSALLPVLTPADYLDTARSIQTLGITAGPDGRLWITSNQQLKRPDTYPLNEVTIWRTPPVRPDGHPGKPKVWFRTTYPHGGGFTHGISHIAFGPDRLLYISSGSRTDGGEKSTNHPDSPAGETDLTAAIWRLDPAATPKLEILARGIRNPYGFAWDPAGNLFTVTNGPDANTPEEMDHILPGHHYGFPYQYSDLPLLPKPYPHTPDAPAGLTFTLPVKNLGPAGGAGLSTFDAHSSPAGTIWCGEDFPEPLRNAFLVTRYGNLLAESKTSLADAGFDVLAMKLTRTPGGTWTANTTTVLAPLGRPIDAIQTAPGTVIILDYTRPTNMRDGLGWMPGRILELRKK